jgi:hypothetical protein
MRPAIFLYLDAMDEQELKEVKKYIDARLRAVKSSRVVDRVPYRDGTLQLETRSYKNKMGRIKESGPYWYYKATRGGKVETLYIGKGLDAEEAKARVDQKLAE